MRRRREFITFIGGAAARPLVARAQQGERMPVVGFLGGISPDTFADRLHAFRRASKTLDMSRARLWESNTDGLKVKTRGCPAWLPNWFGDRSA